jgi:hypothetical protein
MNLTKKSSLNDLIPSEFYLSRNYPNPFKEKTVIKYCVAYKTRVKLTVYNSEGKMIEVLIDEEKEAGTYEVEFSAKGGSASGGNTCSCHSGKSRNLQKGIYYYRLDAGCYSSKKEMTLLK